MTSIPGYDAWKLMSPEDEADRIFGTHPEDVEDGVDDSPEAQQAYAEMWQRAIDNGEFCPTCGLDADYIITGECGGPNGQRLHQYKCKGCGDQWMQPTTTEGA